MKIVLLSATEASLPSMDWILRNGGTLTVLCPSGEDAAGASALEAWAEAQGIPCWQVSAASVEAELEELIRETAPDLVLLYGFPYPIRPALLESFSCLAWNVHYSLERLPAADGRMKGTVTLHEWKGAGEAVLQRHQLFIGRGERDPISRLSDLSVSLLSIALQRQPQLQRKTGPAGPGVAAVY